MSTLGQEGAWVLKNRGSSESRGSNSQVLGNLGYFLFVFYCCAEVLAKTWVFPKCCRQPGKAVTSTAKAEQAPQLFPELAVL